MMMMYNTGRETLLHCALSI